MFRNLHAEITRKGLTVLEFAEVINMNYRTFAHKLAGTTEFKLTEIKSIKEAFDNNYSIEYLFAEIFKESKEVI